MSIRIDPYPTCRHTKTDGRRCKAPALTVSSFCYHHQKLHRTRPQTIAPAPALMKQPLAPLSDSRSLLRACNAVISGLASGQLNNRTAGQMIYLIQLAGSQLAKTSME